MSGRALLTLAALVLIGTAAFHVSGVAEISDWLAGERAILLAALWHMPAFDWLASAIAWLAIAWWADRRAAPLVWVLAFIPGGAAALIAVSVGPMFLGFWLLAGATALAVVGSLLLPRPDASAGASAS